tara:strand:- start:35 stop:1945 length:1911 start_codon:yes stop_codon:yes gene_type:complete
MCGIVGIISPDRPFLLNDLELLNNDVSHRGPDDEGYSVIFKKGSEKTFLTGQDSSSKDNQKDIRYLRGENAFAGMGHRRFSIIDTSSAGRQPFLSNNKKFSVSFNGEIYNYIELRDELESIGFGPFKTKSDTEVLVKAFQAWGTKCFSRFNGFWAVAILSDDQIILSRDRVGKKPLYFTDDNNSLVFASEITALINYRKRLNLKLSINEKAVFDYLRLDRRNTNFDSFFNEIKQVRPSTYSIFDIFNISKNSSQIFWSLNNIRRDENFNLSRGAEKFYDILESSISLRLRADVPLEANLSGGLDSGTIVAIASKLLDSRGEKLTTHNICYSGDKSLDESELAESIANYCGANFRKIVMDKSSSLGDIDSLITAAEEPVHSMSALIQNRAWHQISSEGFKVMLHGSANDEIMLGYDYLKKIEIMNRLRSRKFQSLSKDLINQPILFLKIIKWLLFDDEDISTYEKEFFCKEFLKDNRSRHFDYLNGLSSVNKITGDRMLSDLTHLRIPYWCNLMDKNMMNVPVEVRMPFLDHRFLEYIFSVPEEYLLKNGYTKFLLRYAMKDKLPKKILWQRQKIGFSIPKKTWLNENNIKLFEELNYPGLERFFNIDYIKTNYTAMSSDLSWRILNFAKWFRLNQC